MSQVGSGRRLAAFETDLLGLLRDEDVQPAHLRFSLLDDDLIDADTGEVFSRYR